jgi:hypothetical protein
MKDYSNRNRVTPVSSSVVVTENLFLNPGFEDGDGPWIYAPNASRSAGEARTGSYCGKIITTGNYQYDLDKSGLYCIVKNLKPKTNYTYTAWGKVVGAPNPHIYFFVKNYGGDEIAAGFTESIYVQKKITFTTGVNDTEAHCGFWNDGATGIATS